jgi:SAM-dependent methyltransferase
MFSKRRRRDITLNNALVHETVVQSSPYLRHAYNDVYRNLLNIADAHLIEGVSLEIGGAGGFFHEQCPDILGSDVRISQNLALRLDGMKIPFKDQSLSRIYLKDSLHHISDVEAFFQEARRCLKPGGGIICAEPYWGPMAQLVYRFAHPEDFNSKATTWKFDVNSPFDSNQALLFLLLRKRRLDFIRDFPEIEIIEGLPITGPSYILSGGASRKSLLPESFLIRLANGENKTVFWRRIGALSYTTVFRVRPLR